jgi:hypothetical protein
VGKIYRNLLPFHGKIHGFWFRFFLENHWKIIGKSLVSIGKSIVHWKIIGKSIEMMENPWFSIENPSKNPWFTKASLRGGSGVVPPNRFDATHLPRAFESLGRVHATGSGTACGSCGLVHVFFFRNWVFISSSSGPLFSNVFFLHQD